MANDQKLVLDMFQRPFQRRTPAAAPSEGRISFPRLFDAISIPRGNIFSLFDKSHRLAAKELCDSFMEARNLKELSQRAAAVRSDVNEKLFIYALSFVILRKLEMRNVHLPSIVEVFPSMFVPITIIREMEQKARESIPGEDIPITEFGPEFSGTHLKAENRVAYFREDYGINSHHWHWHLVYPVGENMRRDRKGELFFYMHQQMLARYDMDRLSVGLNRVEKLSNWRMPIRDGYFSKLTINNSGMNWGSRQDNTRMKDYRRGEPIDINDLELWHTRIMDAIHWGFLVDRKGNHVNLSDNVKPTEKRGIELLGDAIEADSTISLNSSFYGDLHNMGHNIISAAHDPDYSHKENLAVMSDTATAVRDPVFFRWHKYIDSLFQEYKLSLEPYTLEELSLPSVEVVSVEVESRDKKNQLSTGWNTRDFEASHGLDFNADADKPVKMRLTHLDHHPFQYNIKVTNSDTVPKEVTVRIFMAPKHNERGIMDFMQQRLLWAEMDRFTHKLKPGPNDIVQLSTSSSVTTLNDFTFHELEQMPVPSDPDDDTLTNFCACGWPQHMLLPRGEEEGMAFQLFVMITDLKDDKVTQPTGSRPCAAASSFCGILDARYPDARPMGFPFDRRPMPRLQNEPLKKASDLTRLSNIAMQDITITFTNAQITK